MTESKRGAGGAIALWALRSQPLVFFLVVTALVFGVYAYFTLPAREDPEILIREALITTGHPGLPSEDVERLITKPIEEALLVVPEIKRIRSTSQDGLSTVKVELADQYTDLEIVWEEIAETVAEVRPRLPAGTGPPLVQDDFGDVAVVTLAVHGEGFSPAELGRYAEHVRDGLITVRGTQSVSVLASPVERIFVETDNAVLSELGIAPSDIARAIDSQNGALAAGTVDLGDVGYLVDVGGAFSSVEEVEATLVPVGSSGTLISLGEIATVRRGLEDPPTTRAYYNGQPAVIIAVAMRSSESVITFSRRALQRVSEIRDGLPLGLDLSEITVQADQVESAVYGVTFSIAQTLLIVLGVVILFLGLRTGLIVGSIVPAVVLATLAALALFGLQLERMSLATIIISLGLLVDNGIVIAEDFKRRLEEVGDRDAAVEGTAAELGVPLLTSSLTTMAVFLPLLLMQIEASEYTRSITYVVIISLSVSWLFSMTVTTTLCHTFLSMDPDGKGEGGWLDRLFDALDSVYERALSRVLGGRRYYMGGAVLAFVFGGWLMGQTPQKFFPDSDRAQILVYADLPVGVTSRTTDARVRDLMQVLDDTAAFPEVIDYAGYVGFGGPRFVLSLSPVDPAPNVGFLVINVADMKTAEALVPSLREAFRTAAPDVQSRVSRMFLGPADPNVIQIRVQGPDLDYVFAKAAEVEKLLVESSGSIDVWSNWRNRTERLKVDFDAARGRAAGVSAVDVSRTLARSLTGETATVFREADERIDVVLRSSESERRSIDRVAGLAVFPGGAGSAIPLGQVAAVRRSTGFGVIAHENLVRTATVEARNLEQTPQDFAPTLRAELDELNATLAPGHSIEFAGILEDTAEANAALASTMPVVLFIILTLLIFQFGDLRKPMVILLTLPFTFIGAAVGLNLLPATFGFMEILGLYALIGVIINNSIVLVDRIEIERAADDSDLRAAILRACTRRLRPIVMTTVTTVVGLLPLILARDVLFYGFATALSFGLAIGTVVVSLFMTPVLYSLFFRERGASQPGASSSQPGLAGMAIVWLVASGCAVGPNYSAPELPTPSLSPSAASLEMASASSVDLEWWQALENPTLTRLVAEARASNFEITQAEERVEQAASALGIARGALLPGVGAEGGASRIRGSETAGAFGPPPGVPAEQSVYEARLATSWEIDLFGRLRRRSESAAAQAEASEWDRRGVVVAVTGGVAREYAAILAAGDRIEIAETNINVARETLELVEQLHDAELRSAADVSRANADLQRLRAAAPPLQAERHASAARLAVLLGREIGSGVPDLLSEVGGTMRLDPVAAGVPSSLLRRRPDIRAAERRLAGENALIGAAIGDLFPRLSLSGAFGVISSATDLLFDPESQEWSIGGLVQVPIFDGGSRWATVRIARSETAEALAAYRQTILVAFAEVESALATYQSSIDQVAALEEAVVSQTEAFEFARLRFVQGLASTLDVLSAQRELTGLRDGLARARADAARALVDTHMALGGGW